MTSGNIYGGLWDFIRRPLGFYTEVSGILYGGLRDFLRRSLFTCWFQFFMPLERPLMIYSVIYVASEYLRRPLWIYGGLWGFGSLGWVRSFPEEVTKPNDKNSRWMRSIYRPKFAEAPPPSPDWPSFSEWGWALELWVSVTEWAKYGLFRSFWTLSTGFCHWELFIGVLSSCCRSFMRSW